MVCEVVVTAALLCLPLLAAGRGWEERGLGGGPPRVDRGTGMAGCK